MTELRQLKKGDRVRVVMKGLTHFGHIGVVRGGAFNCIWVVFDDGKVAPFSRRELRALPRKKL